MEVIIYAAIGIILGIICFISEYAIIKEKEEKYGLKKGNIYDVVINNGTVYKNLEYARIYRGNKSYNGVWNILFNRLSPYRDTFIVKDIVIKYNNIWKINEVN